MKKFITLGEVMLRLTPPDNQRMIQAENLEIHIGGGEANVAISLAQFGLDTEFVTKLPEHCVGQSVVNHLRRYGVGTSHIIRGGDRVGIYYLEKGEALRGSNVVYDRAGSAIAMAAAQEFDWDEDFKDARWFHFSSITAALSDSAAELTLEAVKAAKRLGLKVSFDFNYRKKLWSQLKSQQVMIPFMDYVDVFIGNEIDAKKVLRYPEDEIDPKNFVFDMERTKAVFKQLHERFGFELMVTTMRESRSASDNTVSAMIYDGKEFYLSKSYNINPVVDRVGAGDAFDAGLVYGLMMGRTPQDALEFAIGASALKHTSLGDCNLVTAAEVESLIGGNTAALVSR